MFFSRCLLRGKGEQKQEPLFVVSQNFGTALHLRKLDFLSMAKNYTQTFYSPPLPPTGCQWQVGGFRSRSPRSYILVICHRKVVTLASGGNRSKVGQLVFDPFTPIGSNVWIMFGLYFVDFYGKCTVGKYTIHRFVICMGIWSTGRGSCYAMSVFANGLGNVWKNGMLGWWKFRRFRWNYGWMKDTDAKL